MLQTPLNLLPTPKSVITTAAPGPIPSALPDEVHRLLQHGPSALPTSSLILVRTVEIEPSTQSYRLQINPSQPRSITIDGADWNAHRAALITLAQIIRVSSNLPSVEIHDYPDFPIRGVMLDVSRDRVPTMEHLRSTIDHLASLKFNHLQLYTEHTFAYEGHEEIWQHASPITPAEIRELDTYCLVRGIELAPNQNCFGHLARWLRHPRYRHLAEIERDDQEWRFMHFPRLGPFSLCPTEPRSRAFVGDLLRQLLPCFSSSRVNIGCDETFDVGWGRSKGAAETLGGGDHGRAHLFFQFVRAICEEARNVGGPQTQPLMWADIALTHPDMLSMLPRDVVGLAWEYEPTAKFAPWCHALAQSGHDAWVCPGTSSWRSFTGRTAERRGNIADAAEQGAASAAKGFLICDWGDVGHRQTWPVSLNALAHAAEAAWNAHRTRTFNPALVSEHIFPGAARTLAPWLDELGEVDAPIRRALGLRNATALFNDLHVSLNTDAASRPIRADACLWHDALDRLISLKSRVPTITDQLLRDEIELSLEQTTLALNHAIAARTPAEHTGATRRALAESCKHVMAEHARLWPLRSRPGGLPDSLAHDQGILDGILQSPE